MFESVTVKVNLTIFLWLYKHFLCKWPWVTHRLRRRNIITGLIAIACHKSLCLLLYSPTLVLIRSSENITIYTQSAGTVPRHTLAWLLLWYVLRTLVFMCMHCDVYWVHLYYVCALWCVLSTFVLCVSIVICIEYICIYVYVYCDVYWVHLYNVCIVMCIEYICIYVCVLWCVLSAFV